MKHLPGYLMNGHLWLPLAGALFAAVCLPLQAQQIAVATRADNRKTLAGDTPVISVKYHCADGSANLCELKVTKDEFDTLINALNPDMSQADRQLFAAEYTRVLIMAAHARSRGIGQSPQFQTLLNFSALQLLSSQLVRELNHDLPPVTAQAEERYYHDHERDYREVVLSRIFIPAQPNHSGEGPAKTASQAESVHARALNGEDFYGLQREVAGGSVSPAGGAVSCVTLPEALRDVCDLRPGEISKALPDGSGFSIYRLESRRSRELNEVRQEIRALLERQRLQGNIENIRTPVSLDLDKQYFGELPSSDVAHKHGMHFPATTPAAAPQNSHVHH